MNLVVPQGLEDNINLSAFLDDTYGEHVIEHIVQSKVDRIDGNYAHHEIAGERLLYEITELDRELCEVIQKHRCAYEVNSETELTDFRIIT